MRRQVKRMSPWLIATPVGDDWAVECSIDGPIGVFSDHEVDHFLLVHLHQHASVSA